MRFPSNLVADYPMAVVGRIVPARLWRTYRKLVSYRKRVRALGARVLAIPGLVLGRSESGRESPHRINTSDYTEFVATSLARGIPVRILAEGSSMAPAINHGDLVTVEPLQHQPRIGEIYLRRWGNRLWLHRLISIRGIDVSDHSDSHTNEADCSEYMLAGDNNSAADVPARRSDLLGLAVNASRRGSVNQRRQDPVRTRSLLEMEPRLPKNMNQ